MPATLSHDHPVGCICSQQMAPTGATHQLPARDEHREGEGPYMAHGMVLFLQSLLHCQDFGLIISPADGFLEV